MRHSLTTGHSLRRQGWEGSDVAGSCLYGQWHRTALSYHRVSRSMIPGQSVRRCTGEVCGPVCLWSTAPDHSSFRVCTRRWSYSQQLNSVFLSPAANGTCHMLVVYTTHFMIDHSEHLSMVLSRHICRFPPATKAAILVTLGQLIRRAGAGLKPFVPQLQTTFVKCLNDQVGTDCCWCCCWCSVYSMGRGGCTGHVQGDRACAVVTGRHMEQVMNVEC